MYQGTYALVLGQPQGTFHQQASPEAIIQEENSNYPRGEVLPLVLYNRPRMVPAVYSWTGA